MGCCIESAIDKTVDEMQENLLGNLDKQQQQRKQNRKEQLTQMENNLNATLNHDGTLLIPIGMATGKMKLEVPYHIKEYINFDTYKQLCEEIKGIVEPIIEFITKSDDENGQIFTNAFGCAFDGHKKTRKMNSLNPNFGKKLREQTHERSNQLSNDIQNTRNRQIEASQKIDQMEQDINKLLYRWNTEELKQLKLQARFIMVKNTVNLHGGTIYVGDSTFVRMIKKMVICMRIVDKKQQNGQQVCYHEEKESIEESEVELNQPMNPQDIENLKKQIMKQNQQIIQQQQEQVSKQQQLMLRINNNLNDGRSYGTL